MADVPEELLKRSQEAKARAAAKKAAAAGEVAATPAADAPAVPVDAAAAASYADAEATGKIPAHLLARSAAAKEKAAAGGDGGGDAGGSGGVAVLDRPTGGAAAAAALLDTPAGGGLIGPAGHTQRLLTVVKAGSIQDVKATPTDKVSTWPHLLVGEFVASLLCLAVLLVLSAFVNAPLLAQANYNRTPNPSKAHGQRWYTVQPAVTAAGLRGVWRASVARANAVGAAGVVPRTVAVADTGSWSLANAGASFDLYGVCFPTPAVGFAVGSNAGGAVLNSVDGGASWQPQLANSAFRLEDVFFVDAQRGWAVGANGTIVHTVTGGQP